MKFYACCWRVKYDGAHSWIYWDEDEGQYLCGPLNRADVYTADERECVIGYEPCLGDEFNWTWIEVFA